jgi:Flp pilus assembly protein TadD
LNRLILGGFLLLLVTACATPSGPAPVEESEVESRIRQAARDDSDGVQVFPLRNPAVEELMASATQAEQDGEADRAAMLLERALRIQPRDPELLQQVAEIKLQQAQYQQALNFAVRSYDVGPKVGEICSRNWRTIALAKERLEDLAGAAEAEQRAATCMNTKPPSL